MILDFLNPAVLCLFASMLCGALLLILIALHVMRHRPKDWLPCEAWIVVGLLAVTWAAGIFV